MTDFLTAEAIEDLDPDESRAWLNQIISDNESLVTQIVARREVISMSLKGASEEVTQSYSNQLEAFSIELDWVKRQIASARTLLETL